MNFRRIREHLLPGWERDDRFQEYLRRQSYPGLQTVAAVEIAVPFLMQFGRLAVMPGGMDAAGWWQSAAMALVGAVTLAVSALAWSGRHARLLAAASTWSAAALLTWAAIWRPSGYVGTNDYVITAITIVVITAVATVPMLPWHALALGLAIEAMYILSSIVAARWEISTVPPHGEAHYVFLTMLALLATGIAATNYDHRRAEYLANQEAVRVAEALTGAQLRAQLAENAISIGKMAAALSHELNSPLGTLRSSIDTLVAVTDRQCTATPEERARLCGTREDLKGAIDESAARIDDVTRRLRRFVNLEEAELKSADINELLSDVTLLHQDELERGHIRVEFDLERSIPPLTCRPQLLTAVFSTLLSNAIDAVNGDGRIHIVTRGGASDVEITIRDNGRGVDPEKADTMFDPSFRVEGGRVASGNWSLFNSRQIVYEHGGDIRVETAAGQGTAVHITLPLAAAG